MSSLVLWNDNIAWYIGIADTTWRRNFVAPNKKKLALPSPLPLPPSVGSKVVKKHYGLPGDGKNLPVTPAVQQFAQGLGDPTALGQLVQEGEILELEDGDLGPDVVQFIMDTEDLWLGDTLVADAAENGVEDLAEMGVELSEDLLLELGLLLLSTPGISLVKQLQYQAPDSKTLLKRQIRQAALTSGVAPDYQIHWLNLTSTDWTLTSQYERSNPFIHYTQLPSQTLKGSLGTSDLAWIDNANDLASTPCDNYATYTSSTDSNIWFGVEIHVPTQVFHIGDSPWYRVSYAADGQQGQFWDPVSDPGSPYSFQIGDVKVSITSISGGTSLSLTVQLQTVTSK
ncbi:hypothetical protein BT69DRAFT_1345836 [Atractiella rhizophila]|nr:hypothetical protein BT69DRAFT_1345836 [Atractiella rhizophila]